MPDQVTAVLDTMEEARKAIARLRREGIPLKAITTISAEPFHNGPADSDQPGSRIALFAICGGALGAAFAIALTVSTSRRVDLVTGGMPIVTPWAFGIIVFELTALGAILSTLGRMIFEAKLARRSELTNHREAVDEGRVVVSVKSSDGAHVTAASRVLGVGVESN